MSIQHLDSVGKVRKILLFETDFHDSASDCTKLTLDKEMYVKTIERQLLESIINFLDSKNIDTADLKKRQETILNNGVIVSGGTIESLAFGEKAKATSNRFAEPASNAGGTRPQQTSQK